MKWVLRVSPNGKDEVVWQPDPSDLAPKEQYEVDQEYLRWIRSNKRKLFSMERPALDQAQEEAWRSGKVVDIDLQQSVKQPYYESVLRGQIDAWGQAQLDEMMASGNGTRWQKATESERIRNLVRQLHTTARGGEGQGALNVLMGVSSVAQSMLDVGTGTGRASIQYKNGEIDGLDLLGAGFSDLGTAISTPLMFVPPASASRLLVSAETSVAAPAFRLSTSGGMRMATKAAEIPLGKSRPAIADVVRLSRELELELALVYESGPGRAGGGGSYYLYVGARNGVNPGILGPGDRIIMHTHPPGPLAPFASQDDVDVLKLLRGSGSPQRSSRIIVWDDSADFFFSPDTIAPAP